MDEHENDFSEEQEEQEEQVEDAPPEKTLEEIAEEAANVTLEILKHFPRIPEPAVTWKIENGSIWVEIEGDTTGRLIGRRGQTIDAFQHVLSKIISHRMRRRVTVNVDAERYKQRYIDKLKKLAIQTAEYVAETNTARAMEPMSPADRRIVHITLREREEVLTASEGKDPNRFVVIWPNTDAGEPET